MLNIVCVPANIIIIVLVIVLILNDSDSLFCLNADA